MNLISTVYTQTGDNICDDAGYVPLNGISKLIINGAKILLPAGMLIFFVMLLVGGFKYIASGSDPKSLDSAKGTLTFAFIGLILLFSAWVILNIIGNTILLSGTGNSIFNFDLDGIIKTLSGDSANQCLIGSTIN